MFHGKDTYRLTTNLFYNFHCILFLVLPWHTMTQNLRELYDEDDSPKLTAYFEHYHKSNTNWIYHQVLHHETLRHECSYKSLMHVTISKRWVGNNIKRYIRNLRFGNYFLKFLFLLLYLSRVTRMNKVIKNHFQISTYDIPTLFPSNLPYCYYVRLANMNAHVPVFDGPVDGKGTGCSTWCGFMTNSPHAVIFFSIICII